MAGPEAAAPRHPVSGAAVSRRQGARRCAPLPCHPTRGRVNVIFVQFAVTGWTILCVAHPLLLVSQVLFLPQVLHNAARRVAWLTLHGARRAGFQQQLSAVLNAEDVEHNIGEALKKLSGGRQPGRVICTGHRWKRPLLQSVN